jgi:hypothetical protein
MKEHVPFTYVGYFQNFDRLVEKVSAFTDSVWNEYKERKITGGVASYPTDTIPLLYSPFATSAKELEFHKYHSLFKNDINAICLQVSEILGPVAEKQSIITRLLPGKSIKLHKDQGQITTKSHRVHLPITSNELCTFTVGDVSMNLRPGDIWIIDNTDRLHGVHNAGQSARIHLIVDVA